MKTLGVAHVSDLHLPFEPALAGRQRLSKRQLSVWSWRRRQKIHRPEILAALAADLRAAAPDHIVVTGDLTNFSLPAEFRRAADWLMGLAPPERISVVPGNHDALVPVTEDEGIGQWRRFGAGEGEWPFVHRREPLAFIGLDSALPTAPLLARGRIGARQLARLEAVLREQAQAGNIRIVLLHHPLADDAVNWRRALADRAAVRAVLRRAGAELVLHGHAHTTRLDALPAPDDTRGMIPCLCVPSSSAAPNARDAAARWHELRFGSRGEVAVTVHEWSDPGQRFIRASAYTLCLPRRHAAAGAGSAGVAALAPASSTMAA